VGNNAAANNYSVAVGQCAAANNYSVAVGQCARANSSAVAVGQCARANSSAVAVGRSATADTTAVAVGNNAAAGTSAVAVGHTAAAGTNAVAVGQCANAGTNAVAVGQCATAGNYSVAVGNNAAAGNYSVAVGNNAAAGTNAVAVGNNAVAASDGGLAIGSRATTTAANAIAIGKCANASGSNAVAIGNNAVANLNVAVAIGFNSRVYNTGVAVGPHARASGTNDSGLALGYGANTNNQNGGIAIGTNVMLNTANQIIIGNSTHTSVWVGNYNLATITSSRTSDRRDKFDVRPITNAVALIRDLRPVSFRWNQRSLYLYDNARNPDHGIYHSDYDYDRQQTGEKAAPTRSLGFIAQELEKALEKHTGDKQFGGITSNSFVPDPHMTDAEKAKFNAKIAELEADGVESELSAAMGELMPIVVQAIKELDRRVTALENTYA
ncbi:MAG: tail fiber domain-containing protein, partial [Alistipes sp.]|nr:tail fiber domain-containing protein [Alistipes sp.]